MSNSNSYLDASRGQAFRSISFSDASFGWNVKGLLIRSLSWLAGFPAARYLPLIRWNKIMRATPVAIIMLGLSAALASAGTDLVPLKVSRSTGTDRLQAFL